MDAQTIMNITQQLAVGLLDSCKIFFLTLLFSMPLGLLVTFGRMSKWAPLKFLAPQTLVEKLKLAQSAEGKAENLPMGTRFAGGLFFFKPIQAYPLPESLGRFSGKFKIFHRIKGDRLFKIKILHSVLHYISPFIFQVFCQGENAVFRPPVL